MGRGGRSGLREPLVAFGNRRGGAGCRARAKSRFEVGLQDGLEVGLQQYRLAIAWELALFSCLKRRKVGDCFCFLPELELVLRWSRLVE